MKNKKKKLILFSVGSIPDVMLSSRQTPRSLTVEWTIPPCTDIVTGYITDYVLNICQVETCNMKNNTADAVNCLCVYFSFNQ